jgi:predicted RNA-binding Zn-ribbon protein involved in translation (DUF1610 family)
MRTLIAVTASLCLLAALDVSPCAQAQDPVDDAPRILDQISFGGARPGSVQQTSGVRARGDLVSITPEQVVLRRQARTFEIPMDKVKSITTTDGNFSYSPADETFDSLLRRCRRIPGVSIGKTEVYDPIEPESPAAASNPRRNPAASSAAEPSATEPPAESPTTVPDEPATTEPHPTVTTTSVSDPPPGSTVAVCASCKEQVPLSLRNGDRCPHCGVIIWNGPSVIESASSTYPSGAGGNAVGGNGAGAAYPTAAGAATPAAPATTPIEGGVPASSVGGTFASTPMWMKVALFGGMLAVIWVLLQRR